MTAAMCTSTQSTAFTFYRLSCFGFFPWPLQKEVEKQGSGVGRNKKGIKKKDREGERVNEEKCRFGLGRRAVM